MHPKPIITYLALLTFGGTIGFFIGSGSTNKAGVNDGPLQSMPNSAHVSSKIERNHQETAPSRTAVKAKRMNESEFLSDHLRDRYGADFQDILHTKEKDAHREFLILLAEKDPDEALAAFASDPYLAEDQGLLLAIANKIAATDPHCAYQLIANQSALFSPEQFEYILASAIGPIAQTDPQFAATLISKISNPEDADLALLEISEAWANRDSKEALVWLEKVMQSANANETIDLCYEKILLGQMEHDPLLIAETVGKIKSARLLNRLVPEVGAKLAETDLTGAIDWVNSVSNADAKQAGLENIIQSNAQSHPEAVFDLLASELGRGLPNSTEALSQLTEYHPDFVIENFSTLPITAQANAAERVASAMVGDDALNTKLENWIGQLPRGDVFDSAAAVYALNQGDQNAESAIWSAGQIGNPETRAEVLTSLISNVGIDSIAQVQETLAGVRLDPELQNHLNDQIAIRVRDELSPLILPD